jgi:hypothetical protein
MLARTRKIATWTGAVILIAALAFIGTRIWFSQRGAPLEPWHTFVPEEMSVEELDAADWPKYLAHEDRLFQDVTREVVQKLPEDERIPSNRYFSGSIVYPPASPMTGTAPMNSCRAALRPAPWCCCTG